MPMSCPNCGTQNPDGNTFCSNCGRPLAAAAAPSANAAASATPPPPPPVSPAGTAPGVRLSLPVLLGTILGSAALLTLIAVVIIKAVSPSPPPSPTIPIGTVTPPNGVVPLPSAAPSLPPVPSNAPAPSAGPSLPPVPSNAPAPSQPPSGVVPPLPSNAPAPPAPSPVGGRVLQTSILSVTVPSGWTVDKQSQDTDVLLDLPDGANLELESGRLQSPQTVIQLLQSFLSSKKQKFPDVQLCGDQTQLAIGGAQGVAVFICYTLQLQNGQAAQEADLDWFGTNQGNTVFYAAFLHSDPNSIENDIDTASSAVDTLQWKLR